MNEEEKRRKLDQSCHLVQEKLIFIYSKDNSFNKVSKYYQRFKKTKKQRGTGWASLAHIEMTDLKIQATIWKIVESALL